MVLNIILEFIAVIIELLRLSIMVAVPAFIVVLIAEKLHQFLSKRFSLSWVKATLASTYLIVTLLIMVLYLIPLYLGWRESSLSNQPVPLEFQTTALELVTVFLFTVIKILITGAIYTVMILPFAFFATYVFEKMQEKNWPKPAKQFIAVFAASVLAWIVLLFIFPFAWGGLFYLLYWG